ncbi:glutathione S-transferase [Xylogone sp. PMI_703]|nr:glutathione S-transferase [Xylogone sp. PMI_703]
MAQTETATAKPVTDVYKFAQSDGKFNRAPSVFRSWISSEPGAEFPPEKDRYVLYINLGCPWASRTNLVRTLKGLESIIDMVVTDWELFPHGWSFTGRDGTAPKDPLYGFTRLSQLYYKANPEYTGRFTVPVLWDKKKETIVSNESSEIIRMLYKEFDEFLPQELRESSKPGGGLLPNSLKEEIEKMNEWVYDTVNNGVYKAGFASAQEPYNEAVTALFKSLDKIEEILKSRAEKKEGPYLFGKHVTEADIRLFPTIARFDVAYHTIFMCNLYLIREHYPHIQKWLETLYWDESDATRGAFRKSTNFRAIKNGYAIAKKHRSEQVIVPLGPAVEMLPLEH